MKATLLVSITVGDRANRHDLFEIPVRMEVNLIYWSYVSQSTKDKMSKAAQQRFESEERYLFYYRGHHVEVAAQDVDIPKFWNGKYNW